VISEYCVGKAPLLRPGALIATVASGGAGSTMAALLFRADYAPGRPLNSSRYYQVALKTGLVTSLVRILNAVLPNLFTSRNAFSQFYNCVSIIASRAGISLLSADKRLIMLILRDNVSFAFSFLRSLAVEAFIKRRNTE